MSNHSQQNNSAVVEHNKRVSFGGEEHVQMIEYDDGVENDYSISGYRHQNKPTTYTDPDAPLSRFRVHAEEVELPRPISPPSQITSQPTIILDAVNSSASGSGIHVTSSPASIQMVNPPLPSFVKKAEHENENPFRPDEQLYHEVDPIVELYRQKPFPPSPSHGSPVPQHHQQQSLQPSSSKRTSNREDKVANGDSGGGCGSCTETKREDSANNANVDQPLMDASITSDRLGPPGHAEMVRLPEKKKRSCCSMQ